MNSKEALDNIAVEFDEMGMICSNIAYKDFWEKDLHFKEIFGCEYEIIMKDLDRLEQLEKELKQTKLNFRNSQTHSKNCYKKLKEKYIELQYDYNDLQKVYDIQEEDYDQLFEKFLKSEEENQGVKDDNTRLWHSLECANNENAKLKQAIKILEDRKHILKYNGIDGALELGWLTKKEYELLKEVLESDR